MDLQALVYEVHPLASTADNVIPWTMTVGELMAYLSEFDKDIPVYIRFGNGRAFDMFNEEGFHSDFWVGDVDDE